MSDNPAYFITDCKKKIIIFNKKVIYLWRFPEQFKQLIISGDGEQIFLFLSQQILEPNNFEELVSTLYREPKRVMDGNRFILNSQKTMLISSGPQFLNAEIVGRTWYFYAH